MNDWKKNIFEKFSPILGIEKTSELISSIEKVYLIDNNEDAIMIIDYLIDINNGNIQSGIDLMEEYNKLNSKWWDLEKIRLVYNIFTTISIFFFLFYKDSFSDIAFYSLLGLLSIPLFYDFFKYTKRLKEKKFV